MDALEEERDVAKARSAFYQQQARRYQSREVWAKTYNIGKLYAYRKRRRTSSDPSGKVPLSLTKFSPEERTAYVMLR